MPQKKNPQKDPQKSPGAGGEPGEPGEPGEINPTAGSLLGFLHEGEFTGWELLQMIEQTVGYFWNVTQSHVYRELRTLEQRALIEAAPGERRDKQPFNITDKGRQAFASWIAQEPGQELIRFPLLMTLFFGKHLDTEQLAAFLQNHRARHEQRLSEYRVMAPMIQGDPFLSATLAFGLEYEAAALRWFDSLPFGDG